MEASGSLLMRGVELVELSESGLLFGQGMRAVLCEEIVEVRRLFAALDQRQLADAG